MEAGKFTDYDDIKKTYDSNKYDIFYKKGDIEYEIRNIGSTIYCHNVSQNLGMGNITNFPVENFYAVEKPIPVIVEEENNIINED